MNELNEIFETCKTAEEVEQAVMKAVTGNSTVDEELSETDLEVVFGGMSTWQAIKIASVGYWELCVKHYNYDQLTYKPAKVCEACNIVERLCKKGSKAAWTVYDYAMKLLEAIS